MARVVSSVTLVTTDGTAGRWGITVSAMTSLSADPPLLLVAINRRSPAAAAIARNRAFGVSVLATDQLDIAHSFAGRPRRGMPFDFDIARWQVQISGAPLLSGAVAAFDCMLEERRDAGSHALFTGLVLEALASPGENLLYGRRSFCRPHRLEP